MFSIFLFKKKKLWLIYNVVLISVVLQSDSVIHTFMHSFLEIIFHYGLSQDIEYYSLCYTVGPCLSILCVMVFTLDLSQKAEKRCV